MKKLLFCQSSPFKTLIMKPVSDSCMCMDEYLAIWCLIYCITASSNQACFSFIVVITHPSIFRSTRDLWQLISGRSVIHPAVSDYAFIKRYNKLNWQAA